MTFLGQTPPPGSLLKEKREKRKAQPSPSEKLDGKRPEYLKLVRQLSCCVCGVSAPSECHHVKAAGGSGMGMKVDDKWTVPMCHDCHINGVERKGSRNEIGWFQRRGIDPLTLASALWANRHSLDAMAEVLKAHTTTEGE